MTSVLPSTDQHHLPHPSRFLDESTASQPARPLPPLMYSPAFDARPKNRPVLEQEPIQLLIQDAHLVRHFLDIISPTANAIEAVQPNFFLTLFSTALFCPPLYSGVLAFSALHLSRRTDNPDLLSLAHSKHQRSLMLLKYPWEPDSHLNVDLVLPTLVLYALWETTNGTTPQALDLTFDMAQEALISTGHSFSTLSLTSQRCVNVLSRICLASGFFGARAPRLTFWIVQPSFGTATREDPFLNVPAESVGWLHLYQFTAQVIMLDRELQNLRAFPNAEQFDSVMQGGKNLLQTILGFKDTLDGNELEQFYDIPNVPVIVLSTDLLNHIHRSVTFNALVINLSRILNIRPASVHSSKIVTAAARIVQCGSDPSYHIFPRCLFLAGLESQNPQDV
ncbi:hypothetical protein BT69DRAFT_1278863, partial [Atractiella rhizophila]